MRRATLAANIGWIVASAAPGCGDGQPSNADGGGQGGPLYAVASGYCGPDSCQTYLTTLSSLEPRQIDVRQQGIELEGFVYPFLWADGIFVPSGESPTLTRYTVDSGGNLVPGTTLSFAGVGYSGVITAGRARVINADKAYAFDEANGTIFIWNPTEMTLSGREIDISMIVRPGMDVFVSAWENGARQRGDLLLVPVGWSDTSTYAVRPVSGMLVIDTARDQVVKLLEDPRCPELESSVVTATGDIYYGFPSAAGILDVNARDPSVPACSLRIRSGQTDFDPDYFLDVSALTGGRIGCCGAWGGGSTAYLQVLYEERTGITDRSQLFGAAHNDWRLWRIDLESGQGTEVASYPWFATSGVEAFTVDGRTFIPILTLDGDAGGLFSNVSRSTTLVDLMSGPEPLPTISTTGNVLFFARVR
jgi:hypothetical protein